MSDFNPYHKWLAIPLKDQPPNHYRLLGVELFESDPDVIDAAAEQRMSYVQQCAMGSHMEESQRLLNELSVARICLLNPKKKVAYDAELKARTASSAPSNPLESPSKVSMPATPTPKPATKPKVATPSPTVIIDAVPPLPSASTTPAGKSAWQSVPVLAGVAAAVICLGLGVWTFLTPSKSDKKLAQADTPNPPGAAKPPAVDKPGPDKGENKSAPSEPEPTAPAEDADEKPPTVPDEPSPGPSRMPPPRLGPGNKKQNREIPDKRPKRPGGPRPSLADAGRGPRGGTASLNSGSGDSLRGKSKPEMPEPVVPAPDPVPNTPEPPTPPAGPTVPAIFDVTRQRSEEETTQAQATWAAQLKTEPIKRIEIPGTTLETELALIPPGEFVMGRQTPKHVTLSKPIWVSRTEVTQQQWFRVMATQPWAEQKIEVKIGDDYTATYITWEGARDFCLKLTAADKDGFKYRLLTEAEWEFACRAGTCTTYSFGDNKGDFGKYGRFSGNASLENRKYAHEVGKLAPNRFGLYDMHGNAAEWCLDRYVKDLPGGTDPTVTLANGMLMVIRGGNWNDQPEECTSYNRKEMGPLRDLRFIGFRFAREFDPTTPVASPAKPAPGTPRPGTLTVERSTKSEDARKVQQDWAAYLGANVVETNRMGMDLVLIPPGSFKMGPAGDSQVKVTLTQPLWVSRTEVTQFQWWNTKLTVPWEQDKKNRQGDTQPATNMTWDEAEEFCKKLSHIEGAEYRLLTEAEWEYACRAGAATKFSCGDAEGQLGEHAWFEDTARKALEDYAHPVGTKQPNVFGLHDMHGNVQEWCQDLYVDKVPGGENPLVLTPGLSRVQRSGWWGATANACTSAARGKKFQAETDSKMGLRVARVIKLK